GPEEVRNEGPKAKDQEVEQTLSAGPGILREELVYEYVNRGEEEGIADAMQGVHNDRHHRVRGQCKKRKTHGMPQDADSHRVAPAHAIQAIAKDGHRADFCNLADAHYGHHPVGRYADAL